MLKVFSVLTCGATTFASYFRDMFHAVIRTNQAFFYKRMISRSREFNVLVLIVTLDLARTRKDTFDVKPIFFLQDTSVLILQMITTLRFGVESQAGNSLYQFFQA